MSIRVFDTINPSARVMQSAMVWNMLSAVRCLCYFVRCTFSAVSVHVGVITQHLQGRSRVPSGSSAFISPEK